MNRNKNRINKNDLIIKSFSNNKMEEYYQEIISMRKIVLEKQKKDLEEQKNRILFNIKENLSKFGKYSADLLNENAIFRNLLKEILDDLMKFDPEEKKYSIIGHVQSKKLIDDNYPYRVCYNEKNLCKITIFLKE
jgi:hypothetical protein